MKHIVMTGASGFVGLHLMRRLRQDGIRVSAIIRPGTDRKELETLGAEIFVDSGSPEALELFFRNNRFDGCVHLASCFVREHAGAQIAELIDTNVKFAVHCLEAAAQAGVPWFVNTGTFWQHFENHVYSPVNLYAATKQAFEDMAAYYLATTPIRFVSLMLSDTYGPGDRRGKIMHLWDRVSQSRGSLDMSPGEQFMDVVYIDDVVEAYCRIMALLETAQGEALRGRQFAVSSKNLVPLKALAETFARVLDRRLQINWGRQPYHAREVMIPWNQGEPVPGWEARVSLEEGIRRTFHKDGSA